MKSKQVKLFLGKKPVSIWRITLIRREFKRTYILNHYEASPLERSEFFLTYICLGVDYPSALRKLDFIPLTWEVFTFERFREVEYDSIYQI